VAVRANPPHACSDIDPAPDVANVTSKFRCGCAFRLGWSSVH
jgi:hypothetical protein